MRGDFDMDETSLQKLIAENPIAAVLGFNHMAENIRHNLFGLSAERDKNVPVQTLADEEDDLKPRSKGIYGVLTLNRDVSDTHKPCSPTLPRSNCLALTASL
ncbi:hypothetical protein OAO87_04160 [bacterium]|nr:hypothetical protein [bacterium]